MTLPLTNISEQATTRQIQTKHYAPPVLRPLIDDPGSDLQQSEDLAILEALEGMTNRRLNAQARGHGSIDRREFAFNVWGQNHINAAFAYTRQEGNRFNSGDRGAWYAAFEDLTSVAEVAYHRTRELAAIDHFEDEAVYQALLAGFIGEFHDLREVDQASPYLDPDTETAYPAGQAFADSMRSEGAKGFIYPSARRAGGTCFVAFHPNLVQNVRPGARWKIIWDGSPDYTVTTDP